MQVTGSVPTQVPFWQTSIRVQALVSLHPAPSGLDRRASGRTALLLERLNIALVNQPARTTPEVLGRIDGPEHVDETHVWQMPQGGIDPGEDPWPAALRELNRRWRGIDRATDVLSFPYEEMRRWRTAAALSLE